MITKLFENLILFIVNSLSHGAGHAGSHRSGGLRGLLFRGGRPAAQAAPVAPPEDAPVIIGDILPSAREALHQGGAAPLAVSLSSEARRRHLYILGGTGTGKTNLNVQLLDADVAAGRAVCLLDARGDLVDRVLKRLAARYSPDEIADRLLLIDLRTPPGGAPEPVVGFNPLAQAGGDPYTRAYFVLDVLRQQLGSALGVQTEETLRNCLLGLAMTGGTLLDVEAVMTVEAARARMLAGVTDGGVRRFFARFDALPETQRGLWVNPCLNKITPWLSRPTLRNLLGCPRAVSVREFLDGRPDAILLCCLGADELFGAAGLIGSLVVSAVASAVMRTDRRDRHPLFMYLDEFENFGGAGDQFAAIISEGRRFGLGLTLSHQSSSQVEPKLRALIRNVVGTQVYFATGGTDAEALAGEIPSDEPKTVLRNLLLTQQVGEALLVRRGMAAVRLKTGHAPDPDVPAGAVRDLRLASLLRHGQPAAEVEADLRAREAQLVAASGVKKPGQSQRPKAGQEDKVGQGDKPKPVRPTSRKSAPAPTLTPEDKYEVRDHDEPEASRG